MGKTLFENFFLKKMKRRNKHDKRATKMINFYNDNKNVQLNQTEFLIKNFGKRKTIRLARPLNKSSFKKIRTKNKNKIKRSLNRKKENILFNSRGRIIKNKFKKENAKGIELYKPLFD